MQNADVVIHDSQYTPEEYPSRKNWGHSTYNYVVGMAAAANVKRLFLTHHDPTHNDDFLDRIQEAARQLAASAGSSMKVECAREGFEERFTKSALSAAATAGTLNEVACAERADISLLILLIDDDEDLRILACKALTKAGHRVIEAEDGAQGLRMVEERRPDLILLDLFMPPPDGYEVLRELRANEATRLLPVLVLTAHGDEEGARRSFELGATDFLAKPFSPPQLDARVRACFAHAQRQ
jgi:CheY-like chemotaxis protein